MFHVKHTCPVYHFLAMWLTLPIFLIFVLGCIQLAPDPPMAHARPQPSAAAAASASECYDMRCSPAVNALKIFEFTASKRMPYESMAYKTMETDSKSGSDYGLPFNHCQFLNDNALSKRRYIQRIKHNVSKKQQQGISTSFPQSNQPLLFCNNLPNRQQDIHRFSQWFGSLWISRPQLQIFIIALYMTTLLA